MSRANEQSPLLGRAYCPPPKPLSPEDIAQRRRSLGIASVLSIDVSPGRSPGSTPNCRRSITPVSPDPHREAMSADGYGGSGLSRFLQRCNDFRSRPAAVLAVSTMAVFVDTVVYGLIVPFLPDILQDRLGMSPSANGVLFGCFGAGVLVGAPVSGYISDRWHIRRWPMIVGLLGLGATTVLFALSNAYWELVVARLAQGVSSGITWAIGLGMIADVYPGEALGQAMGVAFSGFTLGYLGGPVLGGAIYSAGGTHAIAIFVAAVTAVDLVFRLLLVEPKDVLRREAESRVGSAESLCPGGKAASEQQRAHPGQCAAAAASAPALVVAHKVSALQGSGPDGICAAVSDDYYGDDGKSVCSARTAPAALGRPAAGAPAPARRTTMLDLLREWPILACCLATVTITGAAGSFEPTLPIHMKEQYGSSTVAIGLVFIAIVIPNVVVGPVAGKYTSDARVLARVAPYGRFGFMSAGSLAQAATIACVGATTSIAGLVVNLVFVGLAGGVAAVPILSTMGVHVERMGGDAYARVYALFNIAYSVGVIVVPTVLPPIMSAVGFAATMGVVAAMLVAGALVLAVHPTLMLLRHGRAVYVGPNARPFL
ncbi:hypothetical protein H4R18_001749 [Coemansia javaensis]|uniref:Major facilitator superfamily (MFS) profile domain-containing protein n=1 Tax=Coemansia javaensis TaxID=2761396 RepID=A0A9W8HKK7_9FUNG|nr:hypothetical protein H4R18_001749 [Coemansia javaensis]